MATVATRGLAIALCAAIVLAAGGIWLAAGRSSAAPVEPFIEVGPDAYRLAAPEPIAEFRLVDHEGRAFDNAALKGRWTFLAFGFTHCPDVCPTTLAALGEVRRLIGAQAGAGAPEVRFALVSVDPERDTPQVLAKYVTAFDPAFVGVTGEAAALARFCDALGVKYARVPGSGPGVYHVDHSSSVLLSDPQGRFHAVFAAPLVPAQVTRAFLEVSTR